MTEFIEEIIDEFGNTVFITEDRIVDIISTGSISLDVSLGIGGVPRGKITEIFGVEGSGKTTMALCIAKEAIRKNLKVLYVDIENMIDYGYSVNIVGEDNLDKLTIIQPNTAEDAFIITEEAINSKEFGCILFDSVGALAPKKEKEDEFDDANVALVPRLMSKFLRRNMHSIRLNNIAFVFINQVRDTIGQYVQSYATPGGHALKHFASIIIFLSRGTEIKQGENSLGINVKFVVKKNKLAPPFRSYTFPIIFGEGIDFYRDLVIFAEMVGVITKSRPYYKYGDINLGKGMNNTIIELKNNKEVLDKIVKEVYNITTKFDRIIEDKEEDDGTELKD